MISVSFHCDEYFVMSMSVVASKLCFGLAVSWIFDIMGHQQCLLLIHTNVRFARSCALQNRGGATAHLGRGAAGQAGRGAAAQAGNGAASQGLVVAETDQQ